MYLVRVNEPAATPSDYGIVIANRAQAHQTMKELYRKAQAKYGPDLIRDGDFGSHVTLWARTRAVDFDSDLYLVAEFTLERA